MTEQPIDLRPMMRIVAAHALDGFMLRVQFDDGTWKTVDVAPLLRPRGPMVQPLLDDPATFRAVSVADGTVVWPNGFDLDPDLLYYDDLQPQPDHVTAGAAEGR